MSSSDDENLEGGLSSEDGASTTEARKYGKSSRKGESTRRKKVDKQYKNELTFAMKNV